MTAMVLQTLTHRQPPTRLLFDSDRGVRKGTLPHVQAKPVPGWVAALANHLVLCGMGLTADVATLALVAPSVKPPHQPAGPTRWIWAIRCRGDDRVGVAFMGILCALIDMSRKMAAESD